MSGRAQDEALQRLADMAAMLREAEMTRLSAAAARRDKARADLAAHDATAPDDQDFASAAPVAARHERWRVMRRGQLNQALARETVAWLEARDRLARAFGRADVLHRLAATRRGET